MYIGLFTELMISVVFYGTSDVCWFVYQTIDVRYSERKKNVFEIVFFFSTFAFLVLYKVLILTKK